MLPNDELARLTQPMGYDGSEWMSEYDPTPARKYVWQDSANARLVALAAHIAELQAQLESQTLRADTTHTVLAAIEESEHQKARHIAGEPARTAKAVAAELRQMRDKMRWLAGSRMSHYCCASTESATYERAADMCDDRADELDPPEAQCG
jgi:hypothetical protein